MPAVADPVREDFDEKTVREDALVGAVVPDPEVGVARDCVADGAVERHFHDRRVDPWSTAKIAGALGALAGLVEGVLLVFAPLAGAAIGFVSGGVVGFLANIALGFAGGLGLELEIE